MRTIDDGRKIVYYTYSHIQVRGWNILTGIYIGVLYCKHFTLTYEYYTFLQYGVTGNDVKRLYVKLRSVVRVKSCW